MADIIVSKEMITSMMGDKAQEFLECLRIVEDIVQNPEHYVGMQAIKSANLLAGYRTLMIVKSQVFIKNNILNFRDSGKWIKINS